MPRWRALVEVATSTVRKRSLTGLDDTYDLSLDTPFYYLPDSSADCLAARIDLIESYRTAALAYWLTAIPPAPPVVPESEQMYLYQEQRLLKEIRATRYILMFPQLPTNYRYSYNLFDKSGNLDQTRANAKLVELYDTLGKVWDQLERSAPLYVGLRRNTIATLKNFAFALWRHQTDTLIEHCII